MAERDEPHYQARSQEAIEDKIEHVPEANIVPANLPKLGELVAYESKRKDVEDPLHDIDIACHINGSNGCRVEREVGQREDDLGSVLIHGSPHPVWMHMDPVVRQMLLPIRN